MSHAPQKPTLEELLRLKRAERPAEDYWARFDAGLRAKQLTALVEKPSWTTRLRARLAWFAAPLGAAAVAALAMVAWLQTGPLPKAGVVSPSPSVAVSTPSVAVTAIVTPAEPPAQTNVAMVTPGPETYSPAPAPKAVVVAAGQPAPTSEAVPDITNFSISVPVNLAAVNESTFAAVVMPVSAPGLALSATPFPEELNFPSAGTVIANEVSRASPAPKDDVRVAEKVLRSLDEEQLNAYSRRLVALDGGRVSFKVW